ncbi:unnamed protein product [Bemisia tabaci]|uniref:Mediator of RNA polymerase II transcription subunit 29 n=1 Tax=Bemisia tabaci TaxID=7038 RepID=A0A451FV14_BEMTA|nr:PREDICTED: mediator of RNA polymerase II transcription subunit 29 [Bemisia tabaci]QAB02863.1 intersex [Bemisia tabaci]CAH0390171.1 unnamed protein product [Bemisia tabaci]
MNVPQMQQPGPGMPPGMPQGPGPVPQAPSLMQSSVSQPPAQEKLDNISKVKVLVNQLRESINSVIKHSTSTLQHNIMMDMGIKTIDPPAGHFDKVLEDFYSLCDQTEIHLKTSIECLNQGNASNRYLPMMVASTRTEPLPNQDANTLTYPQYLNTVKTQVAFTKDIHDILASAAQNINATE